MDEQKMNNETVSEEPLKVEFTQQKGKGFSTAALVLGIIGVCTSFIPIVNNASFVLGILALVFGLVALVKKVGTNKAIVSVVLGVLAIVITLAMQAAWAKAIDDAVDELDYMSGGKTEEILEKYLDVEMGTFKVIEGEYFDDCELEVTVTNKGSELASFSIDIEAIDANGNRIDTDIIYVTDLGAGQGQKFKVFTFVSSDDVEELKQATFRVYKASKY